MFKRATRLDDSFEAASRRGLIRMSRAMPPLRWLSLLFFAVWLTGCTPVVSRDQARALAAESPGLLGHPTGDIASSDWPEAVAALGPERVYRRPEGVYIVTSRFFVEEHGVFVLDPSSSFAPAQGTDPGYQPVAAGVFTYRIAG